ncbi:MAG: hypothetical protein KBG15_21725 [Kofleriaceae bacterium]|nr:hypothetical protein [Kofleriaceae bacterium]
MRNVINLASVVALVTTLGLATMGTVARADVAVPSGAHPRIVLDDTLKATWKKAAKDPTSVVSRMIAKCEVIGKDPKEYDHDVYMSFTWATSIQNCLVAWVATDKAAYATTAIRYFTAILDDRQELGDGKGGDESIRRDSGYPMRVMGPYSALAYDWLYDFPGMTPALKARARGRWKVWTDWYLEKGYHAREAASNYQAGFLLGATLIAIAQGDEAGAAGTQLWRTVVDDLWGNDMAKALPPDGVMAGGDWTEGWQYAPLSIAEYALAGRALQRFAPVPSGLASYFEQVYDRHVAALAPSGQTFANGDTEAPTGNIDVSMLTLAATAISDAALPYRQMAIEELRKLKLRFDDFVLLEALALDGGVPARAGANDDLRNTNATWHLSTGTSTLYARTQWGKDAIWTAMKCSGIGNVDHMNSDAGNVVMSRGVDDVLTDPSPYGTLSTLTSNAPTVPSKNFPADYPPGQGFWSQETGWKWAHQMGNGTVLARCDYADQFRFREIPSDVPTAHRDIIVVPSRGGTDATMIILDEAVSNDPKRDLLLRFRLVPKLQLKGNRITAIVGKSNLALTTVTATGNPVAKLVPSTLKDCWGKTVTRGNCDAARYPVTDYRLAVPGPSMQALHVLTATGGPAPTATKLDTVGGRAGVRIDDHAAVWGDGKAAVLSYQVSVPATTGIHVITDAPRNAVVTAVMAAGNCTITARGDAGSAFSKPLVFALDAECKLTADDARRPAIGSTRQARSSGNPTAAAHSATNSATNVIPPAKGARTGCCDAHASPTSNAALAGFVIITLWLGNRRRYSTAPCQNQRRRPRS